MYCIVHIELFNQIMFPCLLGVLFSKVKMSNINECFEFIIRKIKRNYELAISLFTHPVHILGLQSISRDVANNYSHPR